MLCIFWKQSHNPGTQGLMFQENSRKRHQLSLVGRLFYSSGISFSDFLRLQTDRSKPSTDCRILQDPGYMHCDPGLWPETLERRRHEQCGQGGMQAWFISSDCRQECLCNSEGATIISITNTICQVKHSQSHVTISISN